MFKKGDIMFSKEEKELIQCLVKQELKSFEQSEHRIRPLVPQWLAIEEKYDVFLKNLMEKIKKWKKKK